MIGARRSGVAPSVRQTHFADVAGHTVFQYEWFTLPCMARFVQISAFSSYCSSSSSCANIFFNEEIFT